MKKPKLETGDIVIISSDKKTTNLGVVINSYGSYILNEANYEGITPKCLDTLIDKQVIIVRSMLVDNKLAQCKIGIKANAYLKVQFNFLLFLDRLLYKLLSGIMPNYKDNNTHYATSYVALCHGLPNPYSYTPYDLLWEDRFYVIYSGNFSKSFLN